MDDLRREGRSDDLRHPWLLGLVAVLLLTFKLVAVDRMETPFRRSKLRRDGTLPGVQHPLRESYADGLVLIGFDRSAAQICADRILRFDLHWTVRRQPWGRYQTVIHLIGPNGLRWSPSDTYRPTDYQDAPPTSTWMPGTHALDSHEIEPLSGTPPGTYDVVLTVFDRETLQPLSVLNEQRQPVAPDLTLGQVEVIAPRSPPEPEELGARQRLHVSFGPLTLLGVNFDRKEAAPGDPVSATMFWRVEGRPPDESMVHLQLRAPDGSLAEMYDLPLTTSWHPPSAWEPGDVWRGQQVLHLPAKLGSGAYSWQVSVPPMQQSTRLPTVIEVDAPERTFVLPPVDAELDVQFGSAATLVGASFEPEPSMVQAGETLTTTLVWRAESETDTSYRVFLHLLGPSGELVDQSDGIPAEWRRPTTGWLAGEYIEDVHEVTVPTEADPGDYVIFVGLYGPDGERLAALDGQDAIRMATVVVKPEN